MMRGARTLLAAALLAAVAPLGAQTVRTAQTAQTTQTATSRPGPQAARVKEADQAYQAEQAAQTTQTAKGRQAPPTSPDPAAAADANLPERRVIEDDQVRIEELRVRGMVRSVTVQSKVAGARPYEIVVGRPGRDPSIYRGAAGQSRWSLLDF